MSVKIKGLQELIDKFDDLKERAEESDGSHSVPLGELLTDPFVRACSKFSSLNEMIEVSGYIPTQDEIPGGLDTFIKENTPYASWREMLVAASKEWTLKKLNLS